MMKTPLTGSQRKRLRGLAHGLEATIQVGSSGLTPNLAENVDNALARHELIKVRFLGSRERKKEICTEMEQELECHLAGLVGHVAILYRQASEPADRRIELG